MEIHRSEFPVDMIFGAATAAYQVEGSLNQGGRGPSSWDEMIRKDPGSIMDGDNAKMACKSYYYYKEDVKLAKQLGLDAYRFSISWTRVLPGGRLSAGVNREGIQYYNNLIDELLANGIIPFATIHHFEVPQALEDEYGGFLNGKIVNDYLEFAGLCFWEFGDRVKHWITFNEPWSFIYYGYVKGTMPPNHGATTSAPELAQLPHIKHKGSSHQDHSILVENGDPGVEPYTVSHHLLMAHAKAFHLYKSKFKGQGGQIGITLVTGWYEPLTDSPADKEAVKRQLDFVFGWFMNPITYGHYPNIMLELVPADRLQPFSDEESKILEGSYDFLGLNYYTSSFVGDALLSFGPRPSYQTDSRTVCKDHDLHGNPIGPPIGSPWIYLCPKGLYELLSYIKKTYNDPPIYITENGVDEVSDYKKIVTEAREDPNRIKYLTEHLKAIKKAIVEKRVNVKGYFVWSLMDNFEWTEGYQDRFGLMYVEFKTEDRPRCPKDSGLWYMNFLCRRFKPIIPIEYGAVGYAPQNGLIEDAANKVASQVSAFKSNEIVAYESTPSKRQRKV